MEQEQQELDLNSMGLRQLRELAVEKGVEGSRIEHARDSDDPGPELIALITSLLSVSLKTQ